MIRVAILGAGGRMGRMLTHVFQSAEDVTIVARIETHDPEGIRDLDSSPVLTSLAEAEAFDILVDFSVPAASIQAAEEIAKRGCAWLLATTGLTAEDRETLRKRCASCALFEASNTSFGVALMNRLAAIAAQALADWDCEIVETHHRHKVDAPSGTALTLAKTISEARQRPSHILYERQSRRAARDTDDIGISSLRGGSVAGEHQILWFGDQERLEIKHVAENRAIFANGALKITRWLAGKPAGLYDMSQFVQDIVGA